MGDFARHLAEKLHVIVVQRCDAYEMIGQFGERETGLHRI